MLRRERLQILLYTVKVEHFCFLIFYVCNYVFYGRIMLFLLGQMFVTDLEVFNIVTREVPDLE